MLLLLLPCFFYDDMRHDCRLLVTPQPLTDRTKLRVAKAVYDISYYVDHYVMHYVILSVGERNLKSHIICFISTFLKQCRVLFLTSGMVLEVWYIVDTFLDFITWGQNTGIHWYYCCICASCAWTSVCVCVRVCVTIWYNEIHDNCCKCDHDLTNTGTIRN